MHSFLSIPLLPVLLTDVILHSTTAQLNNAIHSRADLPGACNGEKSVQASWTASQIHPKEDLVYSRGLEAYYKDHRFLETTLLVRDLLVNPRKKSQMTTRSMGLTPLEI